MATTREKQRTLRAQLAEAQQRAAIAEAKSRRRTALSMQNALAGFDAARRDRWRRLRKARGSGDYFLEGGVREDVRDLSRDLYRNDGAYRCMVDQACLHAIGDGLTPQAMTQDEAWNKAAEELWREWSAGPVDLRGVLSGKGLQRAVFKDAFVAGDCGAVGLAEPVLQLIESEQVRTPAGLRSSETMHDGVEVDAAGRVMRYHVGRWKHRGSMPSEPDRTVDARDMFWHMTPDRLSQHRGVPAAAAALTAFEHLLEFREAHLVGAKIAVFWAAAIKSTTPGAMADRMATGIDGEGPGSGGEYDSAWRGSGGSRGSTATMDLQPGTIIPINADESIEGIDTKKPLPGYEAFVKAERGFAAGAVGLPAEVAFLDFGGMNYSSARAALLMARAQYAGVREQFTLWLTKVWRWRMAIAVREGRLAYNPAFGRVAWSRPSMPWIDPVREVQAHVLALNNNLTTLRRAVAELTGDDWMDVLTQREAERREEEARGVQPVHAPGAGAAGGGEGTQPGEPRTPGETGNEEG